MVASLIQRVHKVHICTRNELYAQICSGLVRLHQTEEIVMISDCHCRHAKFGYPLEGRADPEQAINQRKFGV
jgi:hypothetical protein